VRKPTGLTTIRTPISAKSASGTSATPLPFMASLPPARSNISP
jgi:hypothetical protein